jgi:hypothetical protein
MAEWLGLLPVHSLGEGLRAFLMLDVASGCSDPTRFGFLRGLQLYCNDSPTMAAAVTSFFSH